MRTIFFVVFVCSVMYGSALVDNNTILFKISHENVCNNSELLFGNFRLSQVPQFDALCNRPIPRYDEIKILLEDNMIPILCMGVYDVSIRLCKSALNDTRPIYFKNIFPPSEEKFKSLFSMLEETNPSIQNFCSKTVKNKTIEDSSSEVTKIWWDTLNNMLKDDEKCITTCHTNQENQINPLCLFIIWANGVYKNFLNNQQESGGIMKTAPTVPIDQKTLDGHGKEMAENFDQQGPPVDQKTLDGHGKEMAENVDQQGPPIGPNNLDGPVKEISENFKQLGSSVGNKQQVIPTPAARTTDTHTVLLPESSNNTVPEKKVPVSQRGMLTGETMKTTNELTSAPENNKQQSPSASGSIAVGEPMKIIPNNTSISRNGQIETNPSGSPQGKEVKKYKSNKEHSVKKNKNDTERFQQTGTGGKENVGSPDMNIVPPPQSKDLTQSNVENNVYNTEGNEMLDPEFGDSFGRDNEEQSSGPGVNEDEDDLNNDPYMTQKTMPDKKKTESDTKPEAPKDGTKTETRVKDPFSEAEDSHFFTYFLCMSVLTILTYVAFHNKKKLLALALEGRKKRGSRRRPNCSNYRKLDCSLEEAMVSKSAASVTHVLY